MIASVEESVMDPLRAQLGNYLDWLESRGLTGTVAFRAPVEVPAEPEIRETVKAPEPAPSAALQDVVPESPAPETVNWKVGFYSSSDLTEQEFIMVSKIALALGLPVEDFKIWADDSLVRVPEDLLRCSYIVALGPGSGQTLLALGQTVAMNTIQKALQGSPLLTIPHPRAMLREPALKGGAWTALQKFKGLMLTSS
jgi:hypothetical protein